MLNVIWAPMMTVMPHNHRMWALIGIYTGREDNIFWRRVSGIPGKVEAAGAKALSLGDAEPLGHNIIHSVTNPIPRLTAALPAASTASAAVPSWSGRPRAARRAVSRYRV